MVKRNIGERSTVAKPSFRGGAPRVVDVGYSADNVTPVDIGTEQNGPTSKQTPLDKLAPLYGGAGVRRPPAQLGRGLYGRYED
jgi:hypothetical protein